MSNRVTSARWSRGAVIAAVILALTTPTEARPAGPVDQRAAPQAATLLRDIDYSPYADPPETVTVGSTAYFVVQNALWRADPPPARPVRLRGFAEVYGLTGLGDQLLFAADDGRHGTELWRTDGTPAGTRLIRDFFPGGAYTIVNSLTVLGDDVLFFEEAVEEQQAALWRTDGTAAGTVRVRADLAGTNLVTFEGAAYFTAGAWDEDAVLWRTDGTPAGTRALGTIAAGYPDSPYHTTPVSALFALAGRLLFVHPVEVYLPEDEDASFFYDVWSTDPTAAHLARVGRLADRWSAVVALGDAVYFPAAKQLLRLDLGTTTARPIAALSGITDLVATGDALYFFAAGALYRSDGTPAGTHPLRSIAGYGSMAAGSKVYFGGPGGAWVSDGTLGGTRRIGPRLTNITLCAAAGSTAYFTGWQVGYPFRLWRTAGTTGSTLPVVVVDPANSGSFPLRFNVAGSRAYFETLSSSSANKVWVTDGTPGGTRGSVGDTFVGAAGRRAFVARIIGHPDIESDQYRIGLLLPHRQVRWLRTVWDVTAVASSRRYLYVASYSGLFRTDGTVAGTRSLIGSRASATVYEMAVADRRLYLGVWDEKHGPELWVSDGTRRGTRLLKDIAPGKRWGWPQRLTAVGRTLYFTAADGVHGRELWRSDGTAAGTRMVANLARHGSSRPGSLTAVRGVLYFTADDLRRGRELWRSDGTPAGTRLVRDIRARGSSRPTQLTAVGDQLFFVADDGRHGAELWRTHGSAASTRLVRDIKPGPVGSTPVYLRAARGRLALSAADGVHGREVWTSDGTRRGTFLAADVNPRGSSNPTEFVYVPGHLVFAADDGTHGSEPMAIAWPPRPG